MKTIFYFSFLMALLGITTAETQEADLNHPSYPGKCFFEQDKILSPGTYNNLDGCNEYYCWENGWGGIRDCGILEVEPPCREEPKLGKPTESFPECCTPNIICPKNSQYNGE